jgi:hypothetical protein
MSDGVLDEAYERLHHAGPEWGEDQLTNHGPMAVEVLVRRGHGGEVHRWLDRYVRRLEDLPSPGDRITDDNWAQALGDGRRVGDWTAYLTRQVQERPWRDVLVTWWPRLLPGIVAGATHGVIRVSHAVRALRLAGDGGGGSQAVTELAHALAFWAARSLAVPGYCEPAGELDPAAALDAIPRIPDQSGTVATRFGRFADTPGWPAALAMLRPAVDPHDARARLADLVDAAVPRYLSHGHASPVLLVHSATAPNAVLNTLPALPRELWAPSLGAVWAASAAIVSAYAPARPSGRADPPVPPEGPDAPPDVLEWAVSHGDEHVIKFADTAVEVHGRTGDPDALAAARRVGQLIGTVG